MIGRASLLALLLGSTSLARAQGPERVLLVVETCPGSSLDAGEVIDAARVELASDGVVDVRASSAEGTEGAIAIIRVAERCDEDDPAFVAHIDDRLTRKSVERVLVLSGVTPPSVPRALALAVAELLRASWAELELADPPDEAPDEIVESLRFRMRGLREARALGTPTPRLDEAPDETVREPSVAALRVALGALAVVRAFPGAGASPVGGRLALDVPLALGFLLRLEGEALFGTSFHPLGTIDLGIATGGCTFAYAAALETVRITIGARAAGGVAWTRGHPFDPSTGVGSGDGFVLLVGAVLELELPILDVLSLRFGVEAGGAVIGFEARVDAAAVTGAVGGSIVGAGGLALAF